MTRRLIIAIDGPSGAGKSTLGRMLAKRLDLLYIDTGAMYRAAAIASKEAGVSAEDAAVVAEIVKRANIGLHGEPESLQITLDGRNVTEEIRTEEISQLSSVISAIPEVRRALVRRQQELGAAGGVVLEGRDIGSVVFPDADIKFYLTAAPDARAHRRFEEIRAKEQDSSFEETLADINERDLRDTTRADSPLVIVEGAIVIDTTGLSIDQVFDRMTSAVDRLTTK
jgi:cytidylate kinase